MAVTQTTRMAQTRWSAGSDPFTRGQLDTDHQELEDKAAGFIPPGTFAARPAAAAANAHFFYYATDQGIMYYSTGSAWVIVGGGGGGGYSTGFLLMGA